MPGTDSSLLCLGGYICCLHFIEVSVYHLILTPVHRRVCSGVARASEAERTDAAPQVSKNPDKQKEVRYIVDDLFLLVH